jgi:adenosylcobinamide kinase/adenosylcobinamide-phosphate guanylyltransferase
MMAEAVMILGGSGSGKSAYAEEMAAFLEQELGLGVCYLATGTIADEEFARRVALHRQRRPASWRTVEEGLDLAGALRGLGQGPLICLVDGIGTWVSNLLLQNADEEDWTWDAGQENQFLQRLQEFIEAWAGMEGVLILVADEAGMGVVPEYALGRAFRDLNGKANQMLAQAADTVYFVAAGLPLCLKGGASHE